MLEKRVREKGCFVEWEKRGREEDGVRGSVGEGGREVERLGVIGVE